MQTPDAKLRLAGYRRSLEYRAFEAKWFYGVYAACVVGSAALVWFVPDLVWLTIAAQVWLPKISSDLAQPHEWASLARMIDFMKLLVGSLVGLFRSRISADLRSRPRSAIWSEQ